jgi:hypothetical protein
VVTSCENQVTWRRVLHLTVDDAPLCDEHHQAHAHLDDGEPFPPDGAEDEASQGEAES